MKQGAKAIQSKHIMGWTVTENLNLKYLTSFKDRHNTRSPSSPRCCQSSHREKSHKPWPDYVVDKAVIAADPILKLAIYLLVFSGQREGDVVRMRWDDIRDDEILVTQEKTGTRSGYPCTVT